jgi:mRNA interferase MazF
MDMVVRRFEVWLVNLDPTLGKEIKKTRPCLIISPDEANKYLDTIICAPMTTTLRNYPTRVHCRFQKKSGQVALDQIRALDKIRLVKKLGTLNEPVCKRICETLLEYFTFE